MTKALLVVDAQKIYTNPESEMFCRDARATIGRINRLVDLFQRENDPVVLVRHVHRADGSDLGRMFDYLGEPDETFNFKEDSEEVEYDEELVRPPGAIEIIKNRYSAFAGTDLDGKLNEAKVDTVVVCGFMTNFCCESTARCAHDRDYFVDFILDATGTPGTENMDEEKIRSVVGELLVSGFSRVASTDSYLQGK